MENVPSKPSATGEIFVWLGYFFSLNIRIFLLQMDKTLSSMLYQAARVKNILGSVTFPGYVTLPSQGNFTQTGVTVPRLGKVVNPARVTLHRLGNLTHAG